MLIFWTRNAGPNDAGAKVDPMHYEGYGTEVLTLVLETLGAGQYCFPVAAHSVRSMKLIFQDEWASSLRGNFVSSVLAWLATAGSVQRVATTYRGSVMPIEVQKKGVYGASETALRFGRLCTISETRSMMILNSGVNTAQASSP